MTKKEFTDSWKHFCKHIDFGRSNLDAESIQFMNTGIGEVLQTFQQRDDLLEACEVVKLRIHFIGWPSEPMNEDGPDWSKEIALLEAAIAKCQD